MANDRYDVVAWDWREIVAACIFLFMPVCIQYATAATFTDRAGEVQNAVQQFQSTYPASIFSSSGSSASIAEKAVARAEELHGLIQLYVTEAEAACSDRFLVNACLEDVRLQRRQWQNQVRRISLDAKSYLRQQRTKKVLKADEIESSSEYR